MCTSLVYVQYLHYLVFLIFHWLYAPYLDPYSEKLRLIGNMKIRIILCSKNSHISFKFILLCSFSVHSRDYWRTVSHRTTRSHWSDSWGCWEQSWPALCSWYCCCGGSASSRFSRTPSRPRNYIPYLKLLVCYCFVVVNMKKIFI